MATLGGKKSKKKKKGGKNDLEWRLLHEKEQREKREKLVLAYLQNKVGRESASAKLNSIKLDWSWRQILREIKSKELVEETIQMKEAWEQLVGTKNRIIQLLAEEVVDSERRRRSSFERHLDHTDRILNIQQQHMNRLSNNYKAQVENLTQSLDEGETNVESIRHQAKNELKELETYCWERDEELRKIMETEFQNRKEDILNKKYEDEKILKVSSQSTAESLSAQIHQLIVSEREETEGLRKSLEMMRIKDETRRNEIQRQHIQIKKLQETVKQMRHRLNAMADEELNGFDQHQQRKMRLSRQVSSDRRRMEQLRLERESCLSTLANCSSMAIKHLEDTVKQSERVLRWKRMCDLPSEVKEEADEEELGDEVEEDDDHVQQAMISFWRQYNQAYFDKCLLKSHHQALQFDHVKLKSLVKQYMDHVAQKQAK